MPVPANWGQQLIKTIKNQKDAFDQIATPLEHYSQTECAESWDGFLQWLNELGDSWCYRGHREASWWPETSLDRAVKVETGRGYYHLEREPEQRELLFKFQQLAHTYINPLPAGDDICSWLALMQHYGAPTRLLDWTKSSYVALYFALENKPQGSDSAVWAINLQWLKDKGRDMLGAEATVLYEDDTEIKSKYLNSLLRAQTKKTIIIQIDPLRISERMTAQQGIFLCKLYEHAYFSQMLKHMISTPPIPTQPVLRKLTVKKTLRIDFLKRLREMNIHSAALFPGLDGFGKSLKIDLEIKAQGTTPKFYDPPDKEMMKVEE